MVRLPKSQVHAPRRSHLPLAGFSPRGKKRPALAHWLFPKSGLKAYRLGITWAHIAIIPTNSPIDAKAAASSTKILNITASCLRT
jgi:hypothetical protein